jgi:ribosomal protein S27E
MTEQQIKGIKVKCDKCGYQWIYKGRSKIYVTCPQCHKNVNLQKLNL